MQALDMISGCFSSLRDLGVRARDGDAAAAPGAPSLEGRHHPANQFFGVLWPKFKQVLDKYYDDEEVVDKQCR